MVLNIASLNINGGWALLRRVQTIQACESLKTDIILPQETHATNTLVAKWGRLFKGQWFLSGFPTPKAAVAIFLSHKICAQKLSFKEIYRGHLISMDFVCNKQKIIVVNVYAPSDPIERKKNFFHSKGFY